MNNIKTKKNSSTERTINMNKTKKLIALIVVAVITVSVAIGTVIYYFNNKPATTILTPAHESLSGVMDVLLDGDKPSGLAITKEEDFNAVTKYFSENLGNEILPLDTEKYSLKLSWPKVELYENDTAKIKAVVISNIDNFDANNFVNANGEIGLISSESVEYATLGNRTIHITSNGICTAYSLGDVWCVLGTFKGFVDTENGYAVFHNGSALYTTNGSVTPTSFKMNFITVDSVAEGIVTGSFSVPSPVYDSLEDQSINYTSANGALIWSSEEQNYTKLQAEFDLTN